MLEIKTDISKNINSLNNKTHSTLTLSIYLIIYFIKNNFWKKREGEALIYISVNLYCLITIRQLDSQTVFSLQCIEAM